MAARAIAPILDFAEGRMSTIFINSYAFGGVVTYAAVLRDTYGASEIWPLVNITGGTTIGAFVNSARNGTLTGWDLQNAAGPVTDTLAPLSGTGDFGNIYSASLASIFNGNTGSLFCWFNQSALGTSGRLIQLRADGSNRVLVAKISGTVLRFNRLAAGTSKTVDVTFNTTGWTSFGLSWSTGSDELKAFLNGSQTGTTQTSIGTYAGTLNTVETVIGAESIGGDLSWNSGWLAYACVKFGSIWTPTNFADMHAAAATAGPD